MKCAICRKKCEEFICNSHRCRAIYETRMFQEMSRKEVKIWHEVHAYYIWVLEKNEQRITEKKRY